MSLLQLLRGLVLVSVLALAGCFRPSPSPAVLLITYDTTRADHLESYGYPRSTGPALERWVGSRSVRFSSMTASSNLTSCSFASLFTGLHVKTHGVTKIAPLERDSASQIRTLAEVLHEEGYETVAAVSVSHLNPEFSGFGGGFDRFFAHSLESGQAKRPSEEVTEELVEFLETRAEKPELAPLFLWVHYFDSHMTYDPPARFREEFSPKGLSLPKEEEFPVVGFEGTGRADPGGRDLAKMTSLYDAELLRSDHSLDRLFRTLDEVGLLEPSVVVFTADHGENLGEHGLSYHHGGLFQPVVGVPLMIGLPGMQESRTSDALVSHVDLLPTILEAAGIEASRWPIHEGMSLVPLLRGEGDVAHDRVFSEASHSREKMVRDDRFKLIVDSTLQKNRLYDLREDPSEERDLFRERPEKAKELQRALDGFVGRSTWTIAVRGDEISDEGTPRPEGEGRQREGVGEVVFGSMEIRGIQPGVRSFGLKDSDWSTREGEGRIDSRFRIKVEGETPRGFRVDVGSEGVLLDIASNRSPVRARSITPNPSNPRERLAFPLVVPRATADGDLQPAPTSDPPFVLVEWKGPLRGSTEVVETRFTLLSRGQQQDRLFLRLGTDGEIVRVTRLEGRLGFSRLGGTDRFRVDQLDARGRGAFSVEVRPPGSRVFFEGFCDGVRLENTNFRIGSKEDSRAYPTTFLLVPVVFESRRTGRLDEAMEPGVKIWCENERTPLAGPGILEDVRLKKRLRALGYTEDP